MTTLTEYDKQLAMHDWFYDFTEDHRVWRIGNERQKELGLIANESQDHKALLESHSGHRFSGDWNGKPKKPAPKLAFWLRPESDSVFVTTDESEYSIYNSDPEVSEVDEAKFIEMGKK